MNLQLKDKTALVTGSTAGIGFAIAKTLAEEGAKVILNGRNEERLATARAELQATYPEANLDSFAADFAKKEDVERLIQRLPVIDILINNVGIFTAQSFTETSDEDWYRLFEVNVMSGVRLSRALLPGMLQRNWGRIIFVSSECAALVPEDLIAYSTTKAALHSISRGLAQLTKGSAVTVNTVMPGSTLSEGAQRFLQEQAAREGSTEQAVADNFFKEVRTSSLIARFASTEEVAHTTVYLASPLAAATNGSVVKLDGGSVGGIM